MCVRVCVCVCVPLYIFIFYGSINKCIHHGICMHSFVYILIFISLRFNASRNVYGFV